MLDFSLTKMAVIGVVSLVVLGPERLPRVARTAGALLGRAQRYLGEVKAEVKREIEFDELRRLKTDFESAAADVRNTVDDNLREHQAQIEDAVNAQSAALRNAIEGSEPMQLSSVTDTAMDAETGTARSGWSATRHDLAPLSAPRKNWRIKRTVVPAWYRRVAAGQQRTGRATRPLKRPSVATGYARRFF